MMAIVAHFLVPHGGRGHGAATRPAPLATVAHAGPKTCEATGKRAGRHDLLSVVICSDGMSRGMDIELVSTVINYDVPAFAKTYVHRCGRTARAGKEGTAISLLKGG